MEEEKSNIKIHNAGGTMGHSLSDFYPLIGILAVVAILTTGGVQWLGQDLMLAFMGYFFLVFGLLKVVRINGFVEAYQMYDVLATRSKAYAYVYPFLEKVLVSRICFHGRLPSCQRWWCR